MGLKTPCALVDLQRLTQNCRAMSERAARFGVRLRPHVKTHKCVEAARLQVEGHFGGITVSTLAEASRFASAGFKDIVYAVPIHPGRFQNAAEIASTGVKLGLLLDNGGALTALEDFCRAAGRRFPVWLKVDCGGGRAGVLPGDPSSVALARRVAQSGAVDFAGILTHAGQAYHCRSREEVFNIARHERDVMLRFAGTLDEAGAKVPEISIGSTPTLCRVDHLRGVTEARPGNYVFYDAFQAALGSCSLDNCAFTVLATVIGHYPQRNGFLINCGALALSKDEGPVQLDPACGYGVVCDTHTTQPHPHLRIVGLSQEHGRVKGLEPIDYNRFPIGSTVRIIPNHSCLAAACFDRYFVIESHDVVDEWIPVKGW
ncbi:MAG: alanine racemase [Acidobacteriota bacterium]|jgi:D-serine deaminase-like pyridoxal phosphate-dependent protein